MSHQPVNPDDLDLTAYALGEMTNSERIEFENRLQDSPDAQLELEAMDEITSLLSSSLRDEWRKEMKEPSLEVLPGVEERVVTGQFRTPKRAYVAAAAAFAALLVAGAAVLPKKEIAAESAIAASTLPTTLDISQTIDFPSLTRDISVPQVFLTEEIENPENLNLAAALENLDELAAPVDASYLEAHALNLKSTSPLTSVSLAQNDADARVDSYLPNNPRSSQSQGLIEKFRTMRVMSPSSENGSVFVRGYVAMDSDLYSAEEPSTGHLLPGFRPVSMIGNPVQETEVDLRILSELQSIQSELKGIVEKMPEDSKRREQLKAILERNREAVTELKSEFSH